MRTPPPHRGDAAAKLARYDQLKQQVRDIKAEHRGAAAAKAADKEVRLRAPACGGPARPRSHAYYAAPGARLQTSAAAPRAFLCAGQGRGGV